METYLDGQSVTLAIPLSDEGGEHISATSVEKRIVDQSGTELVVKTVLAGFTSGDAQAIVAIPASVNSLNSASGLKRELRIVELYLTTDSGVTKISHEYVIEAASVLELGVNSFQTYHEGVLLSLDIPNLQDFGDASRQSRISALIAAWRSIGRLHLRHVDDNDMTRLITPWAESGNVTELTAEQFELLPSKMKSAIRRAQIIEANHLLGRASEANTLREQGVIAATVGESSQYYMQSKPYDGICGKDTLRELSKYIVRGNIIARA